MSGTVLISHKVLPTRRNQTKKIRTVIDHSATNRKRVVIYAFDKKDGDSSSPPPSFSNKSIEILDALLERQRANVQRQSVKNKEMKDQLDIMKASPNTPQTTISFMQWVTDLCTSIENQETERLRDIEHKRETFLQEVRAWEQRDKEANDDNQDQKKNATFIDEIVVTGEEAAYEATAFVVFTFISATAVSWVASWFGINLGSLLPDPEIPTVGQVGNWVAWTTPYAAATVAAALISREWIGNRGTFRYLAEDSFFANLHPSAILSLALSSAYAQGVVWQGVYLLAFLRAFGGGGGGGGIASDEYLLTMDDGNTLQQSMGTLIAAPSFVLGPLFAAPVAVACAATLEAGFFALKAGSLNIMQDVISLEREERERQRETKEGGGDERDALGALINQPGPPEMPTLPSVELSEEEFWSTTARVFLASVYMGAETLTTGNLWYAIATGAVGLCLGLGVNKSRGIPTNNDGA